MAKNPTGRQPRDYNVSYVKLTPHLRTLTAPIGIDWFSRVADWGMMLNDHIGDCTCAACGHIIIQQSTYSGQPVSVTDDDVLTAYEFSGYDPADPATDQGWTIQAALDYLHTWGMAGVSIKAYGEIDHRNRNAVKMAIYEFGALSVGVSFPESAHQQFEAGEPWTLVGSSAIDGGHCIVAVGYDPDYVYCVTWGKVVKVAWLWWDAYVEEAWAVITEEWDSVTGLSLEAFGQEWADEFGIENPFARSPSAPKPHPMPHSPRHYTIWDRLFDFLRRFL